jgi:hypothetical protein
VTIAELRAVLEDIADDFNNCEVVLRVTDTDDELHVVGLHNVSIDSGCDDIAFLALDGDQNEELGSDEESV